ncbi:MAG TPA: TonB-dependent receptor plug domain-containing protein, partial [Gemmatimonadaceae bacterium]
MTRRAAVGGTRRAWLAAFASVAVASAATAQSACPPSATTASRAWAAPLDRKIALQARDVSLRDGLDRVAAAAKFRLSYSAELVPLSRHVCVATESVIAGEALLQLLAGSGVEAVVTGPDQVVLTPKQAQLPDEVVTATVQNLDRVVVTGSATGNAQRSLSVALDVLDGDKLRAQSTTTLSQTFDGSVPGLWVWEQSPSSMLARYGSIRGASSFGLSYPKVYIDGIEVANPLLMVQINPSMVDHVEVIRGPQGAALYGADAISGVVNIVTRHEGTQSGADRAEVVTGAGLSRTSYTPKSVFTQNHALTWRGGSSVKSGTLSVNATTLGDYVPSAYSRDLRINGAARAVTT